MGRQKHEQKKLGKQPASVAEQTKREILMASLHLFGSAGYESTSLRDIAAATNTTHGLIRHHFGTKEGLWIASVGFAAGEIARLQLPVLEKVTEENALESIELIIRTLINSAARYPDVWRILALEALEDSHRLDHLIAIARPIHEKIAPLFELVQSKGHFSKFTNDTFFLAIFSLGAMPFALSPFTKKMCNMDVELEETVAAHADLVIDTLFAGIKR